MQEISEKEYKDYKKLVKQEKDRQKERIGIFLCVFLTIIGLSYIKTWATGKDFYDALIGGLFLVFASINIIAYLYQRKQEKDEAEVRDRHNPVPWLKESRVIQPGKRPFWGFLCVLKGHLIVGFRVVSEKARTIMESGENYNFSGEGVFAQCIRCGRVSTGFRSEPRDYDDPEVIRNMIWGKEK